MIDPYVIVIRLAKQQGWQKDWIHKIRWTYYDLWSVTEGFSVHSVWLYASKVAVIVFGAIDKNMCKQMKGQV